jgi:phosphoglycerate dehydrogenase-like enzyme
MLDALPNLDVVARCGAGLDNIDVDDALARGIRVVHAPGVTDGAVAEAAVLLMLAVARRLPELATATAAGNWAVRDGYEGVELAGRTLGVIGLGGIGSRVAELGTALGMDVVYTTRSERATPYQRLPLHELLARSDVVQLCVPLTPETSGLMGVVAVQAMKPGAILVNTSRGPIVDHRAIGEAVASGRLGGYAADVWDPEPPEPGDALLADSRTILTPHVAALTDVTYREICVRASAAAVAVLRDEDPDPRCVVRPDRG